MNRQNAGKKQRLIYPKTEKTLFLKNFVMESRAFVKILPPLTERYNYLVSIRFLIKKVYKKNLDFIVYIIYNNNA